MLSVICWASGQLCNCSTRLNTHQKTSVIRNMHKWIKIHSKIVHIMLYSWNALCSFVQKNKICSTNLPFIVFEALFRFRVPGDALHDSRDGTLWPFTSLLTSFLWINHYNKNTLSLLAPPFPSLRLPSHGQKLSPHCRLSSPTKLMIRWRQCVSGRW